MQAADELLSDTLNDTLLRWLCKWNGLTPCKISRQIKPADDRTARAEADAKVYAMGYEPTQPYIDEHYGTGWLPKKQTTPPTDAQPQPPRPASFAEGNKPPKLPADQLALDAAVQALPPEMLAQVAREMLTPIMQALDDSASFEELLAVLEGKFPTIPTTLLQSTLAEAMFGAQLHGVASVDAETKAA